MLTALPLTALLFLLSLATALLSLLRYRTVVHGTALLAVTGACIAATAEGAVRTALPLTALPGLLSLAAALLSLSRLPCASHCRSSQRPALLVISDSVTGDCVAVTAEGTERSALPLTALPCLLSLAAALLSLPKVQCTPHCRSRRCSACCHWRLRCCHCRGYHAHRTAPHCRPRHSPALLAVTALPCPL